MIVFLMIFMTSSAQAYSYIKCGDSVDFENSIVEGYELEIYSTNDNYHGPVGQNWNLKLNNENSEWLDYTEHVFGRQLTYNRVEIYIIIANSPTGVVGTKYKLFELFSKRPILEKYTMGGFVGTMKIATFNCISTTI